MPPAVSFPYGKMGQSASGLDCDLSGGKFGPFERQLFVGDQTHSTVMRVFLEKVNGRYQGVLPVPGRVRLRRRAGAAGGGRVAVRRRHQPRLGLARAEAVLDRAAGVDRQDAF
ncbi:MAG: hypothetical protein U0797_10855 [Gemmataceae bacterium]